jgi:hypothetical protein
MRESITLPKIGAVKLAKPSSVVAAHDVVAEYSQSAQSRAKLVRIAAAALGICWSRENEVRAPIYDVASGEVIAYGGGMLEWLMKKDVDPFSMLAKVTPLFADLWEMLPKVQEVDQAVDYFPDEGQPGSGDIEDRKAVAP